MIEQAIAVVVSNYPLTFFVIGLIVAGVAIARAPRPITGAVVVDRLLAWYVLFNIGVMYLVNFVFHVFFGQMSAASIGWADSPFQFEVGMADLAIGATACAAFWRDLEFKAAAICAASVFLLGDAAGHIKQMVVAGNFAPGNAGVPFYMDVICPLLAIALWAVAKRSTVERLRAPPVVQRV